MKQFFARLNWRGFQPADEREQNVYNKAYRLSYRAMLTMLLGLVLGIMVFQPLLHPLMGEYKNSAIVTLGMIIYIIIGTVLSEWIGGRAFIGESVSFTKRQTIRWYDREELSGFAIMAVFIIVSVFIMLALSITLAVNSAV